MLNKELWAVVDINDRIQYFYDDMNHDEGLLLPSIYKEYLQNYVELHNEFHEDKWKVIKIRITEI